ncbi:MAG: hypothetical protein KC613_01410 [Myxococcales bacterium]|nr:hypothetical protein [Myxococcales bacterium]
MRRLVVGLSLAICTLSAAGITPALAEHRVSAMLGVEGWNDNETSLHGALLLAYDSPPLWRGGTFGAEYNTETLRLTFNNARLGERVWLNAQLGAEYGFAGLLPDYYQDGLRDLSRGFKAGWVQALVNTKFEVAPAAYMELELGGRRWIFEANDKTDPALVLPPETWVFEPRLRYTGWWLAPDAAWGERHRSYARHRGIAAGAELGLDMRATARPWGARALDPPDPRNDPGQAIVRARQWLRAGWQLDGRVRTEVLEFAALGAGEDDLTRDRIGGMNPYVSPLAGAPWASWLSEKYAAVQWSWHVRVWDDLELGPLANGVVLVDPDRTGAVEDVGALYGVGALVDWRRGPWQVDLRGGWSPGVSERADRPAYSVWLGVGWAQGFGG